MKGRNILFVIFAVAVLFSLMSLTNALEVVPLQPMNNSLMEPQNITFTYNLTNVTNTSHTFNCSIYLGTNISNLVLNQTNSSVLVNVTTEHNFTVNMNASHGVYYWKINCTDNANSSIHNETPIERLIIDFAPEFNLTNLTFDEDTNQSVNLSNYTHDKDNDSVTFALVSFNSSEINCSLVNSTLTIVPVHNWNGNTSLILNISDGFQTINRTVNLTVRPVEDAPIISEIPTKEFEVNESFSVDMSSYASDPDSGDVLNYSISGEPSGVSINTSTGILSGSVSTTGDYVITLKVCDNHNNCTSRNFTLKIVPQPPRDDLVIDNVDAIVDGYDEGTISSGDNIKVSPGSNLTFKIRLKNDYSLHSHIYIKHIVLEVTIQDIDNGDDLVERTKEFNLRYDASTTKTVKFHIPLKVYEGDYTVRFNVSGVDDNGNPEADSESATVSVEKQDHDVRLVSYNLFPTSIACDREIFLTSRVMNLGESDEDDAVLIVESKALGIEKRASFSLAQDPFADDNSKYFSYEFSIPDSVKAGNYSIILKTYYTGGVLSDYKVVALEVNPCGSSHPTEPTTNTTKEPPKNPSETNETIVVVSNTESTPPKQHFNAETVREASAGSQTFLILLITANILVIVLIVLFILKLLL